MVVLFFAKKGRGFGLLFAAGVAEALRKGKGVSTGGGLAFGRGRWGFVLRYLPKRVRVLVSGRRKVLGFLGFAGNNGAQVRQWVVVGSCCSAAPVELQHGSVV
ncbi:hypothetical protein KY285_031180 [Solanum tuberosum]|nr:hypothetical protein KY285_031180 [Solanum tuberosum]